MNHTDHKKKHIGFIIAYILLCILGIASIAYLAFGPSDITGESQSAQVWRGYDMYKSELKEVSSKGEKLALSIDKKEPQFNEGVIMAEIYDDFDNLEKSETKFYLINKTQRRQLTEEDGFSKEELMSHAGDRVKIDTSRIGGEIVLLEEKKQASKKSGQTQQHNLAVILVDYLGTTAPSLNPNVVEQELFDGDSNRFFFEQSYEQMAFTGDVFGPFDIDIPDTDPTHCRPGLGTWYGGSQGDIDAIIEDNSINITNYQHILVVANCASQTGPAGYSSVGSYEYPINGNEHEVSYAVMRTTWDSWWLPSFWNDSSNPDLGVSAFDYLVMHELGHSLGVYHGDGYNCHDVTHVPFVCQYVEYGNHFDAMGAGRGHSHHFNAAHKETLGWLDSSSLLEISNPGSYSMRNLESRMSGFKAAVILHPTTGEPLYYLENRIPYGYDRNLQEPDLQNNQNGLLISRVPPHIGPGGITTPRLLDMQPTLDSWYDDVKNAALLPGASFTDEHGITITVINTTQSTNPGNLEGKVSFEVAYGSPTCIENMPIIDLVSDDEIDLPFPSPFYEYTFTISIESIDTLACPDSHYEVSIDNLPAGWSVTPPNNLGPITNPVQSIAQAQWQINIPSSVLEDTYTLDVELEDIEIGDEENYFLQIEIQD